jgi:hypothetical protein
MSGFRHTDQYLLQLAADLRECVFPPTRDILVRDGIVFHGGGEPPPLMFQIEVGSTAKFAEGNLLQKIRANICAA